MIKQIRNAKTVQAKSKKNVVHPLGSDRYQVVSATSGNVYNVRYSGQGCTCSCSWGTYRSGHDTRSGCSHSIAVMSFVAEQEQGRRVSAWASEEQAAKQHRPAVYIGDGVTLTSRAA